MEALDPVLLARVQFALTVAYHFIFVPLSIGIGLIMAIFVTKAYRSKDATDEGIARMWMKIFTATFAIGVATGITMEFSFGTNWATYSRFVGDIFGAPLAAEALFAFFLESVFLGILLFGKNKVSPKFYMIAAWLVWFGSCLSALWILIANSWMQTPAGGMLSPTGNEAIITDFFAAAFNPSTLPRYFHTVLSLLVMGAFISMAIGAWYLVKHRHQQAAARVLRVGAVVGVIATCVLLVSAHSSAVEVTEEQPTKLAMMEGMYEDEVPPLYLFGWVDQNAEETLAPFAIPGGTSFLATGTWDTEMPGLNTLAETEKYQDMVVEDLPVNLVFQSYHLMVALFGVILIVVILALIFTRRKKNADGTRSEAAIASMGWLQKLLLISPIFPFLAIQAGWFTAEVGRQPWVVYPSTTGPDGVAMLTEDGVSASVSTPEILITLALFGIIYLVLLIGWARVVVKFINDGPAAPKASAIKKGEAEVAMAAAAEPVVVKAGAAEAAAAEAGAAGADNAEPTVVEADVVKASAAEAGAAEPTVVEAGAAEPVEVVEEVVAEGDVPTSEGGAR